MADLKLYKEKQALVWDGRVSKGAAAVHGHVFYRDYPVIIVTVDLLEDVIEEGKCERKEYALHTPLTSLVGSDGNDGERRIRIRLVLPTWLVNSEMGPRFQANY